MAHEIHAGGEEDAVQQETLQVLEELSLDACTCELLADPHRLYAYLRIATTADNAAPDKVRIFQWLEEKNLSLDDAARNTVEEALRIAAKAGVGEPVLIAEGTEPIDGVDGEVEWLVRRPSESARTPVKGARVDYKERNALVNVLKGQKILHVKQATNGSPGVDVLGNHIPCRQGKPAEIRKGRNVEFTDNGLDLIALTPGYIEESGDTVSVEPVLTVKGDVDLSVGNIDFVGPVKISGDVLDGFIVKAGGEIEVNGTVEGARLESPSFVAVRGGIAGKAKGRVICKGTLEARYLNEVYVEAVGDVKVNNSIVSSTIRTRGAVDVLSGGIRGSNVIARNGLHSPEIGSETGVRTIVIVGVDYDVKEKVMRLDHDLATVKDTIAKIESALGPILNKPDLVETLPRAKAQVAKKLLAQLKTFAAQCAKLTEARDKMAAAMQTDESVCIVVDRKILPGVMIQIGNCRRSFEMEVAGPLRLYPDVERESLRVKR